MTPMHDLPEHQMIPVDANGNGPAVNVHHYECRCGNRACDRALVDLQGWKAEATTVLAAWEEVWVTAGQPGPLGGSKAAAVKAVIERLNAAAVAQDTAVDHLEAPAVTDLPPQQVIARQLRGAGMPTKWAVHDAPEVIKALNAAGYRIVDELEASDDELPGMWSTSDYLRALLAALTDPTPCRLDHNGYCQEHLSGEFGEPPRCATGVAQEVLAAGQQP